jgi:hypothetical protein
MAANRKAVQEAYRIYRITEVALYRAEREGRTTAAERLKVRLQERWRKYRDLQENAK